MDVASLQVTLDGRKAREEIKGVSTDLNAAGDAADKLADRGQKAMNTVATATKKTYGEIQAHRKEVENNQREYLQWAQSSARLAAVQGNLSGAISTLNSALSGSIAPTNQVIRVQTQLAQLQQQMYQQQLRAARMPPVIPPPIIPGGGSGSAGGAGGFAMATQELLAFAAAYVSVRSAISEGQELLRVKILFENLDLSLNAVTGSAPAAARAMSFLESETDRLGLNLEKTIPEFVKITAAFNQAGFTFKQSQQIFTDISIATRALGLSTATTNRVLYDMQEMASLGTVQMRQLRQMIMQMPGGMDVAARAAGTTTEEFHKLLHEGLIPAKEFLPLLAEEFRRTFGESSTKAMDSTESAVNRLSTAWLKLKGAVADTVPFKAGIDTLTWGVKGWADALEANEYLRTKLGPGNQGMIGTAGMIATGGKLQLGYGGTAEQQAQAIHEKFGESPIPTVHYQTGLLSSGPTGWNALAEYSATKDINATTVQAMAAEAAAKATASGGGSGGGGGTGPASDDAIANWEKAIQLQDKFYAQSEQGLDKQIADIERNAAKEKAALDKLFNKPPFRVFHPGKGYDTSGQATFEDAYGNPYDALEESTAKQIEAAKQAARDKSGREFFQGEDQLQKLRDEINAKSQPDKRLQELAALDNQYREMIATLDDLNEAHGVEAELYDKVFAAWSEGSKLIEAKYQKTFVAEGTLSELLQRRLELEKQLLEINETDPYGADRAQKIQNEMRAIERQSTLKERTGSAGPAESFIYGWDVAMQKYGTISQGISKMSEQTADSMTNNVSGALASWATGASTAQEAFTKMTQSMLAELTQIIAKLLIMQGIKALSGAFGGGGYGWENDTSVWTDGGSGYGIGVGSGIGGAHSGGVVGALGGGGSVSSMVFAGARRYHTGGVVGDEQPIIARKGEGVFTPEQMAALGQSRGRSQKVEIINVQDPRLIDEYLAQNPNAILNVLAKNRSTLRRLFA